MLTVLAVTLSLFAPVHAAHSTTLGEQQLASPVPGYGWTVAGGASGLVAGGLMGIMAGSIGSNSSQSSILLGLQTGLITGVAGAGIGYLADTGHEGVAAGLLVGGTVLGVGAFGAYVLWSALTSLGSTVSHSPSFL